MAVRVKCRCGKVFQVSSKFAGKKISCAGCGWQFSIPKERFESPDPPAPQKAIAASFDDASPAVPAKPQVPPPPMPPPASPLAALDSEPADLKLDVEIADLSGTLPDIPSKRAGADDMELRFSEEEPIRLELADDGSAGTPTAAPPGSGQQALAPVNLNYSRDPFAPKTSIRTTTDDAIQGPARGFWADAFMSFVYPFRTGSNVITFIMICIASAMRIPLSYLGCYALIPIFIIFGWIASFYLSIVQETASGSDDLPGIKMEDGFLEDIIKPALKYIGAFAVAVAPATLYLILMGVGVLPDALVSGIAFLAWMAGGFFVWPVFVLLFAFNALNMIFRVDLIFTTIFRTFGAYVAIWLMLLLVGCTWMLPIVAIVVVRMGLNLPLPTLDFGSSIAVQAVMDALDIYLTIVSMRLIGLYYLHFKRRFTLVFE